MKFVVGEAWWTDLEYDRKVWHVQTGLLNLSHHNDQEEFGKLSSCEGGEGGGVTTERLLKALLKRAINLLYLAARQNW